MTLPPRLTEVLAAVAGGPLPWREPGHIAVALGWRYADTVAALEGLLAEGLVERWDILWRPEPYWTLSPLGAEAIGLDLVELGHDSAPVWRERDEADAAPPIVEPRDPALDGRPYPNPLIARLGLLPPPPPSRQKSSKRKGRRRRHPEAA